MNDMKLPKLHPSLIRCKDCVFYAKDLPNPDNPGLEQGVCHESPPQIVVLQIASIPGPIKGSLGPPGLNHVIQTMGMFPPTSPAFGCGKGRHRPFG